MAQAVELEEVSRAAERARGCTTQRKKRFSFSINERLLHDRRRGNFFQSKKEQCSPGEKHVQAVMKGQCALMNHSA